LETAKPRFAQEYGVSRIGVFGSAARGEQSSHSDIDIIVHMESPSFDRYMDLKFELEDQFGVSVDLVIADSLKPRLRPEVERETVYA
jgi:hypothetical protein